MKNSRGIYAVYDYCQSLEEFGSRKSSEPRELREAMTKYNEELVKAGVRIMVKGLHPSSNGIRLSYPNPGGKPVVTDGPFTETNELIAGSY